MFRVQQGIVSQAPAQEGPIKLGPIPTESTAKKDADVIMTTALLGFAAGRLAVGHPVKFDLEISAQDLSTTDDEKLQEQAQDTKNFATAVDKLNRALQQSGNAYGGRIEMGTTPEWKKGAMITGAAGASLTPFAQRHREITDDVAKEFQKIAADDKNVGYQGRGAYTGFIDDPVGRRGSIKATARFNVPSEGFGNRWLPKDYEYSYYKSKEDKKRTIVTQLGGSTTGLPWGLITGGGLKIDTMEQKRAIPGGLVGYTHGMVQSIYDAVAHGPWCTPFEIAVGSSTTKLASCIPCTLFMYAAGYPPSSIHLGRGESWIPFYPKDPGTQGYSVFVDEAIRSVNTRWYLECQQHLALGVRILENTVTPGRRANLNALDAYLRANANDLYCAANLILDAATVHDSETNRILATIS